MTNSQIIHEITPTHECDFFLVKNYESAAFDFPTHYHKEYELNLITGFEGRRIIGDSVENLKKTNELVLIGPTTVHSWHGAPGFRTPIVTIQFSHEWVESAFFGKNLFNPIKNLLEISPRGILFSRETREMITPLIRNLTENRDFSSVISFLTIMHQLSQASDYRILASPNYAHNPQEIKSRRIQKIYDYIHSHYGEKITISDVAKLTNMTESGFCHFFRKRASKSFIEYLNEVRIGYAAKMLVETKQTISEISFKCGYSTISNFNRMFKSIKGMTPSEFRQHIRDTVTTF